MGSMRQRRQIADRMDSIVRKIRWIVLFTIRIGETPGIVRGKQPKAKGRKNDLLILVQEEPDSNEIIYVNQLCVDGIRHKENEWYGIAD